LFHPISSSTIQKYKKKRKKKQNDMSYQERKKEEAEIWKMRIRGQI